MTDVTSIIKQSVTIRDICAQNGIAVNRAGFACCPFHAEKTPSMKIYDNKRFKCYGCGASGDVIEFASRIYNLPFKETISKLNTDFNLRLPIGDELTDEQRREAERQTRKRKAEQKARQNELNRLRRAYNAALDYWTQLDKIAVQDEPKSPTDNVTDRYVYAMQNIESAWYEVERTKQELQDFQNKQIV